MTAPPGKTQRMTDCDKCSTPMKPHSHWMNKKGRQQVWKCPKCGYDVLIIHGRDPGSPVSARTDEEVDANV